MVSSIDCLEQRLANYGSQVKCNPLPMFVNKVLLEHSHAHLFMYCLYKKSVFFWVLKQRNSGNITEQKRDLVRGEQFLLLFVPEKSNNVERLRDNSTLMSFHPHLSPVSQERFALWQKWYRAFKMKLEAKTYPSSFILSCKVETLLWLKQNSDDVKGAAKS